MQHKLSEIINTDCYIQFDSNEQLREWVKKAGVEIWGGVSNENTILRFGYCIQTALTFKIFAHPIYHHTNIEI